MASVIYNPNDTDIGEGSIATVLSELSTDSIEVETIELATADIGGLQIEVNTIESDGIETETVELSPANIETQVQVDVATAEIESFVHPPIESGVESIEQDYTDTPGERSKVTFNLVSGTAFDIFMRNGLNGKDGHDAVLQSLTMREFSELRDKGLINPYAIYPIYKGDVLQYVYFGTTLVMRKAKDGEKLTNTGVFPLTFPIIFA